MFPFPLAPEQASDFARTVDAIFAAITALTIFFTVVVLLLVVIFAVRYRQGSKVDRSRPQHENLRIEIAWSLPPLLLGLFIFAWGATAFVDFRRPPKNAMEIFVIGKQWMWHLQHPNGIRENNQLHIPVGVPIKLTMISQDVLHEFYVPQFRIQYEVIPGRYTYQWFTATKTGKFYLFCNQFCGTQHSEMGGYVYVMSKTDYAKWLANGGSAPKAANVPLVQAGENLYNQLNCANCHGLKDTERAPSLYGIAGKERRLVSGGTATADDTYIRDSIVNPYAQITAGYTNTMPEYKSQLTEEQIQALVQYVKSLGNTPTAAPLTTATPTSPGAKPGVPRLTNSNRAPEQNR